LRRIGPASPFAARSDLRSSSESACLRTDGALLLEREPVDRAERPDRTLAALGRVALFCTGA